MDKPRDTQADTPDDTPKDTLSSIREALPTEAWRELKSTGSAYLPGVIKNNITAKLLVLLLIGTLISGGFVFVMFNQINDSLSEQVETQVESDASVQANVYDTWLTDQWQGLQAIADLREIEEEQTFLLNTWLSEITRDREIFEEMHVINESGVILGSSNEIVVGMNVHDEGLDESALEFNNFISQQPIQLGDNASEMAFLGTDVPGEDRILIGAIPVNTTLADTFAFDGVETTVRAPDGQRVLGPTANEQMDFDDDLLNLRETSITYDDGFIHGMQLLAHHHATGAPEEEFDENRTTGVVIVTSVPESEAFAIQQRISSDMILAFGLTFLLLIGTAAVSMRSVTSAVNELSRRAREISEGSFDTVMESSRTDEIGALYLSVSDMRDSLQARMAELEDKEKVEKAREEAERAKAQAQEAQAEAEALNQQLTQKAEEYSATLSAFSDGDMTVRMDTDASSEELVRIAESFNNMAEEMESTIIHIREFALLVGDASDEITDSAREVKQTSEDVSQSVQNIAFDAEEQRDQIQKSTDQMTDLSASIEEVTASIDDVADQSSDAADRSEEGREYASRATDEMDHVGTRAEQTLSEIKELDDELDAIGQIVSLIEDIAEQTNMLALNASIEAARAGEAGEGFAIVADEIKILADETQTATDDIESLITQVQRSAGDAVSDMRSMRDSVDTGIDTVDRTVDALTDITERVEEADVNIQSISRAADEQAATTEEVVTTVEQAGGISEQTADEATEVAAATEEQTSAISSVSQEMQDLAERARQLQELTEHFIVEAETGELDE